MKKTIALLSICGIAFLLAGCGHNAVQYSDGIGVELGLIPDQYQIALNFRYGKIFSAVVKEKTEIMLETEGGGEVDKSDTAAGKTSNKTILTFKTGDQVTGRMVELEEAKAKKTEN